MEEARKAVEEAKNLRFQNVSLCVAHFHTTDLAV